MNNRDFLGFALSDKWYIFPANVTYVKYVNTTKSENGLLYNHYFCVSAMSTSNEQMLLNRDIHELL